MAVFLYYGRFSRQMVHFFALFPVRVVDFLFVWVKCLCITQHAPGFVADITFRLQAR